MVDEWEVTIPQLSGYKKRRAYVYLPENYEYGEDRYPVLYMFDGQNLFFDGEAAFGKSWGLKTYLDNNRIPLIVAAVECNTEGDMRLSEYSPEDFMFGGKSIKGRGKKYMDWLVGTFKPYIDENLRTLPDRKNTAIAGSSMGGLMTFYALSKYGAYFSKGAALSPSLWVAGGEIPPFLKSGKIRKDTVLYTDYGSREMKKRGRAQKDAFINSCAYLMQNGVNVTSGIILNGTHSEASWEKRIPLFMRVLYGDFKEQL